MAASAARGRGATTVFRLAPLGLPVRGSSWIRLRGSGRGCQASSPCKASRRWWASGIVSLRSLSRSSRWLRAAAAGRSTNSRTRATLESPTIRARARAVLARYPARGGRADARRRRACPSVVRTASSSTCLAAALTARAKASPAHTRCARRERLQSVPRARVAIAACRRDAKGPRARRTRVARMAWYSSVRPAPAAEGAYRTVRWAVSRSRATPTCSARSVMRRATARMVVVTTASRIRSTAKKIQIARSRSARTAAARARE